MKIIRRPDPAEESTQTLYELGQILICSKFCISQAMILVNMASVKIKTELRSTVGFKKVASLGASGSMHK